MPSLDYLLPFIAATAVFAYMPGPAMLYTAAQTLARGRAAGFMAALGIHIGGYVHVLAATLGLSAALRYVPELYLAVKLAGAAYLIWLGIRILLQKRTTAARAGAQTGAAHPQFAAKSAKRALVESMIVEVLNPKVAMFFIAFLPQFVDPAAALPIWAQFLILGTIVNLAFSSADIVVVVLASRIVQRAKSSGLGERIARLVGGTVLIGLGARMALARD